MVKTRYTWTRKTRAQKTFLSTGFFSKKIKWIQNVFKWGFLERINKLDPYFELFHAINKLERSRNPLDKRIRISYNQHSLPFLERKQFA